MAMNFIPQVDYTSRDYAAIRDDLIANIPYFAPNWTSRDSSDFGIIMLEMYAYVGDLMSFYIDRMANEAFIGTATQRDSVLSIANLLGYQITQGTPATVDLSFGAVDSAVDITVPAGTVVATSAVLDASGNQIEFETDSEITVPAGNPGVTVTAHQGRTVTSEVLTNAFNGLPGQSFQLANSPVDIYSVSVTVNGVVYSRVDHLIDYPGNAPVFTTTIDANNNVFVVFGDNLGGRIPPISSSILATYRVINGTTGNVPALAINYILTNYSPGLTVINSSEAYGGSDVESTESIRANAPKGLRALSRAVTLSDYANLAIQVAGVGKTNAAAQTYSSITLYMASIGGEDVVSMVPTAEWNTLASKVSDALSTSIPPGVTVTVSPPVYKSINISADIYVQDMYKRDGVETDVGNSLAALLTYENVFFGQTVSLQDVLLAIATTPGVLNSAVTVLSDTLSGVSDVVCADNEIPVVGTITLTMHGGIA